MQHSDEIDQRLMALEVKASFAEDMVDQLSDVIARQQQQIDALQRAVAALQQISPDTAPATFRNLRDELPPHY